MTEENEKLYFPISLEILALDELSPLEKMVLARIASFKTYFESVENCAGLFHCSVDTIRKARQKLENKKYIKCIAQGKYGKIYAAAKRWKINEDKPSSEWGKNPNEGRKKLPTYIKEESKINTPPTPPQGGGNQSDKKSDFPEENVESTPEHKQDGKDLEGITLAQMSALGIKHCEPTRRTNRVGQKKFEKQYPDLVQVRNRIIDFLEYRRIPVTDVKKINTGVLAMAKVFRSTDDKEQHVRVINQYIDFLESPQYEYQVEKNPYCPRITTQDEISLKMAQVRNFAHNPEQWYDPNKKLTR